MTRRRSSTHKGSSCPSTGLKSWTSWLASAQALIWLCHCRGPSGSVQEYIVITIVVAAQGKVELPKINNQESLVKALNKLAALRQEDVMAVEVLWTPEDEDDAYSRDEMLMDYPSLNNV